MEEETSYINPPPEEETDISPKVTLNPQIDEIADIIDQQVTLLGMEEPPDTSKPNSSLDIV